MPDIPLRLADGRALRMSDLAAGKPLLVAFFYRRCTGVCTPFLEWVRDAVRETGGLGTDYRVLALSFDDADTVADVRAQAETLGLAQAAGWSFAVAERAALARVTGALEFWYRRDPTTGQYDHPALLVGLDRGRVVRALVGGPDGRERLRAMVWELRGNFIPFYKVPGQTPLACLAFDPDTGKTRPRLGPAPAGAAGARGDRRRARRIPRSRAVASSRLTACAAARLPPRAQPRVVRSVLQQAVEKAHHVGIGHVLGPEVGGRVCGAARDGGVEAAARVLECHQAHRRRTELLRAPDARNAAAITVAGIRGAVQDLDRRRRLPRAARDTAESVVEGAARVEGDRGLERARTARAARCVHCRERTARAVRPPDQADAVRVRDPGRREEAVGGIGVGGALGGRGTPAITAHLRLAGRVAVDEKRRITGCSQALAPRAVGLSGGLRRRADRLGTARQHDHGRMRATIGRPEERPRDHPSLRVSERHLLRRGDACLRGAHETRESGSDGGTGNGLVHAGHGDFLGLVGPTTRFPQAMCHCNNLSKKQNVKSISRSMIRGSSVRDRAHGSAVPDTAH
ncbi:MAG: SCO family protein [Burkholderiales bacterium]|nr:SCO family protein [Burkholderiales bacterium]